MRLHARRCLQLDPKARPTMEQVVAWLKALDELYQQAMGTPASQQPGQEHELQQIAEGNGSGPGLGPSSALGPAAQLASLQQLVLQNVSTALPTSLTQGAPMTQGRGSISVIPTCSSDAAAGLESALSLVGSVLGQRPA